MDYHSGIVVTLANSIIGVSILAMPYCFKQTGILLSFIMLLLSNLITRLTCHFLIKSAIISRRRTFEYLAYYIFGGVGKFAIEIGMIGFLIGTCIAFFVVMGDLGPDFIAEITGRDTTNAMRTSILMALALFCVLPLGLLRNVESLNGVSKATIGFYFCLMLKIIIEAMPHIFRGDWMSKVDFWRPAGIIQCLPIFSMALSCQSQLFEIYKVVHNPTLEQMNSVVKSAVNICTIVYCCVGFFGYVAFAHKNFTGNILLSFEPSKLTNVLKFGFVLSVAFSFPLVIFPCRASMHSLIYREMHTLHESMSNYIPEGRFKGITLGIIFISLVVGILIPNIELVLGLVGSTIGIAICVLFPVLCFIYVSQKDTNERLLAKFIFIVGFALMILGTYENFYRLEKIESSPIIENFITEKKELFKIVDPPQKDIKRDNPNFLKESFNNNNNINKLLNQSKIDTIVKKLTESSDIRHEPAEPIEPQEPEKEANEKVKIVADIRHEPAEPIEPQEPDNKLNVAIKINPAESIEHQEVEKPAELIDIKQDIRHEPAEPIEPQEPEQAAEAKIKPNSIEEKLGDIPEKVDNIELKVKDIPNKTENKTNNDEVDIEAIRKDENEMQLQQNDKKKETEAHLEEHKILLDTIQKQNEVQEEIVKQQQKLIEVIQEQNQQKVNEEKLKAVKEIESIALKAIEKISSDVKQNEKIVAKLQEDVKQKVNSEESQRSIQVEKEKDVEHLKIENILLKNKIKSNVPTKKPPIPENIVKNNDTVQGKPKNLTDTVKSNNTAPLFLNLGQNPDIPGKSTEKNNSLPILPQVNVSKIVNESKPKETNLIEKKNLDKNLESESKVMRREILSYIHV